MTFNKPWTREIFSEWQVLVGDRRLADGLSTPIYPEKYSPYPHLTLFSLSYPLSLSPFLESSQHHQTTFVNSLNFYNFPPFKMKTTSYALALAASFSSANAYWKGFNAQATLANGACKTQADWEKDFNVMKALPGGFSSIRVYASSDCNTLANAVPAAVNTGGTILASVWTQDDAHFEAEKQALLSAVQTHGVGWLVAITVGSEDLYRKETSASTLASKIYDVRGMMTTVDGGSAIQIGHVDTWTAWVDGANEEVITACDFVGTDGYPYFQNTQNNPIDQGSNLFWESTQAVRDVVNRVKPGAWVWITEVNISPPNYNSIPQTNFYFPVRMANRRTNREPSHPKRRKCSEILVGSCMCCFRRWPHLLVHPTRFRCQPIFWCLGRQLQPYLQLGLLSDGNGLG